MLQQNFDPRLAASDIKIARVKACLKTALWHTRLINAFKKIDKNFETPLLNTVRGAGYILRATAA